MSSSHDSLHYQMPDTDWSLIYDLSAAENDAQREQQRAALERLVRRYWSAIYAFLRRSGKDVHEASDLCQGFITTVILERGLVATADRARGRFRTLLLTSLKNYLRERHRYDTRKRRAPEGRQPVRFSEIDMRLQRGGAHHESPEAAFIYHYSATLVRQILDRVQHECLIDGLEPHWTIFEARVARPLLTGMPPTSLERLVDLLELNDTTQASNLLITVKRRFAKALYKEIQTMVTDESDVEDEIRELLQSLA